MVWRCTPVVRANSESLMPALSVCLVSSSLNVAMKSKKRRRRLCVECGAVAREMSAEMARFACSVPKARGNADRRPRQKRDAPEVPEAGKAPAPL
jgi:hypothetical protein